MKFSVCLDGRHDPRAIEIGTASPKSIKKLHITSFRCCVQLPGRYTRVGRCKTLYRFPHNCRDGRYVYLPENRGTNWVAKAAVLSVPGQRVRRPVCALCNESARRPRSFHSDAKTH